MIRNYFKIALRNLYKNKLYAFVNITGLTVGIASCILIGVYIMHETSYDRFHANADRIARVTMEYNSADAVNKVATTGTKVGPEFQRSFPERKQPASVFGGTKGRGRTRQNSWKTD